ncbi:MAG: hypothetical protein Q9211_006401, partial [Gyalolechia sp. 1 TL-2023]
TVHSSDFVRGPGEGGIEVVEGEEGAWVEVGDVVFGDHVAGCPVGFGGGEGGLVFVVGVGEEVGRKEGEKDGEVGELHDEIL